MPGRARAPDPFAPPDWAYARADGTFGNRFDDPSGRWGVPPARRFRVISFASTCAGAFGEVLAALRPALPLLAALADADDDGADVPGPAGLIARTWPETRRRSTTRLAPTLRIVDLGDPVTWQRLRPVLAAAAVARGLSDIDLSAVTGPDRLFTQLIARYLYEQRDPAGTPRYAGVRYLSRLNPAWECWGIFADRLQHEASFVATIQLTDSAVLDAAAYLGLEIELPDGTRLRP